MDIESVERRLARYEPSAPPSGLKEELANTVLLRARQRRNARLLTTLAAVVFVASVIVNVKADHMYEEAVQIANWKSQSASAERVVAAPVLSTQIPGAHALLKWNGGQYD